MRSISLQLGLVALAGAVLMGCAPGEPSAQAPRFEVEGTRAQVFETVDQLAAKASAIIVATPTGKSHAVPLPAGYGGADSAPTWYVGMKVDKVLRGELSSGEINLVSPGIDVNTGKLGLLGGGPFLLFITPAMYGPNDPAGGYVVVGGPAGVYAKGEGAQFQKVDGESRSLPLNLTGDAKELPQIVKSEAQLLSEGP